MNIAILIPAYNPDQDLILLVENLSRQGFFRIVIVNDGSKPECNYIFERIKQIDNTVVLQHSINMGKGAALKLGFDYVFGEFPSVSGVVTADADGQHSVTDIVNVSRESVRRPDSLILGKRMLDKNVPVRSLIGNRLTAIIIRLLFGVIISDTQTGLRAVPRFLIPKILAIAYNRYEFEMEMLLLSRRENVPMREVTIETIYRDNNASSHFNPLIDSVKVYFVLFRYVLASVVTAGVDFTIFVLASPFVDSIMLNTFLSRFVALFVQYTLVRTLVFNSRDKVIHTFPKYILLVIISGFISGALVNYFITFFRFNIVLAKTISEVTLYIANFVIQKDLIFKVEEKK